VSPKQAPLPAMPARRDSLAGLAIRARRGRRPRRPGFPLRGSCRRKPTDEVECPLALGVEITAQHLIRRQCRGGYYPHLHFCREL